MRRTAALAAAILLAFSGCGAGGGTGLEGLCPQEGALGETAESRAPALSDQAENLPPEGCSTHQAVLLAAGDNLIHDVIYLQAARRAGNGGYDFGPAYERLAPLLGEGDFLFVNQETVLAGDRLPPSSYPLFCSPSQVGEELLSLGFNLIATANNHAFDQGAEGLEAAEAFWSRHPEAAVAGAYGTAAKREDIPIITRKGISVALVAATESTNGLQLPPRSEAGVLRLEDLDTLYSRLEEASRLADVVVLSLHWGEEGSYEPSAGQRVLAAQLAEAGADIILGHHSHILQKGEFIPTSRGKSYVIYSLGNFISAQITADNLLGGLLRLELIRQEDGKVVISSPQLIPIVTHYGPGFKELELWPLAEYTQALAASHGVLEQDSRFGLEYFDARLKSLGIPLHSGQAS